MEFGFGMGIGPSFSHPIAGSSSGHPTNTPPYLYGLPSADTLRIDDLLDFSNHDVFSPSSVASAAVASDAHILPHPSNTFASKSGCSYNSHNSHFHSHAGSFADELYMPSEEAAELEWLSKFVEDSFTDAPYPSNYLPAPAQIENVDYPATAAAPGRGARSKRSRNLQVPNPSSSSSSTSSSSSSDFHQKTPQDIDYSRNVRDGGDGARRCTHCASEKTPQWRTGPLGPKTLCNACGVRYKSGRLVPEYRPAASPTFVLTQHSNSHRKVVELRRQKEQLHGIIRPENHSSH